MVKKSYCLHEKKDFPACSFEYWWIKSVYFGLNLLPFWVMVCRTLLKSADHLTTTINSALSTLQYMYTGQILL
jgi:hypothetical protein